MGISLPKYSAPLPVEESRTQDSKATLPRRDGSVLLMVLVVIAMLTLGTATYLDMMQNERKAVRHHGRGVQAVRLAESGAEYAKTLLALTPAELLQLGGLHDNPTSLAAVIVDDQPDGFDRGRFTLVAPAQVDGLYAGYRYGLENESAKLNVNTLLAPGAEEQAQLRLLALPGMSPETADAILDWLDADDQPRLGGAESETYQQFTPPYKPRNGAIADLDELLLIRGVTPELLYGLDQNRNFLVEATEQPRGLLAEVDNSDGSLNRGWSAYLTTSSVETLQPAVAAATTGGGSSSLSGTAAPTKIDLNSQNLQQLYNDLRSAIGDDKAKFIIVYRQYGPQALAQNGQNGVLPGQQPQGGTPGAQQGQGGQNNQSDQGGNAQQNGQGQSGQGPNGAAGPAQPPVTATAASLQLKFDQQGENQFATPLDLIGAKVQIPGEGNQPAKNVDSPWLEDPGSYRDMLKLYDVVSQGKARRVAGRVNINLATRPVLRGIPGLPAAAVGKIVARREVDPDMSLSDQRHPIWLLIDGVVSLQEMKPLERYITTGGDAFSAQVVGFFDQGPSAARGEFILERDGTTPRLRAWRELTSLGRGFSTAQLGVQPEK